MKFHILSAAAIIATSTLLPMSTIAAPFNNSRDFRVAQEQPSPDFEGGMRRGKGQLMEQLNLTPQQQENINKIREDYKGKMEGDRQKMRQLKEEMRQLMVNGSEAQIRAKHKEMQTLQQKFADARFDMMLKIRNELTDEQRAKMAEFKEQRFQGRRGQRGQGVPR